MSFDQAKANVIARLSAQVPDTGMEYILIRGRISVATTMTEQQMERLLLKPAPPLPDYLYDAARMVRDEMLTLASSEQAESHPLPESKTPPSCSGSSTPAS